MSSNTVVYDNVALVTIRSVTCQCFAIPVLKVPVQVDYNVVSS